KGFPKILSHFHAIAHQPIQRFIYVVETCGLTSGPLEFDDCLVRQLRAVPAAIKKSPQVLFLDIAIYVAVFPVAEVFIPEPASKYRNYPVLRPAFKLADGLFFTGHISRIFPVNSCCIMPCFSATVFSRRASSAEISASMSDRNPAIASCSALV